MRQTLTVKELRNALAEMPDEAEVYVGRWAYPQGFQLGAVTGARLGAPSRRLRKFVEHNASERDPAVPDVVMLSQWALGPDAPLVVKALAERSIRAHLK